MITAREVLYSIYGAWRLARLDRRGMDYFDISAAGFWNSFFAAVIVAPAHVLLILLDGYGDLSAEEWVRFSLIKTIAYVIGWTAWPLAMVYLSQAVNRSGAYFAYMVAYNWAQVIGTGLFVLVALIAAVAFEPGTTDLAYFMTTVVLMVYQWFIARVALNVSAGLAVGLVFLDLALSIFIGALAMGVGGQARG